MGISERIENSPTKIKKFPPPEPNKDLPSKFILDCLDTENEGDGMLYAALLEEKTLYGKGSGIWYQWAGHHWANDEHDTAIGLVRYVTDRYGEEIAVFEKRIDGSKKSNSPDDHKMFAKAWERKISMLQTKIRKLRQPAGRNACVEFARTNYNNPLTIKGDEFDKDPWLLGVQNGVIDLRSGEIYKGEPGQLISKCCSCDYLGIENVDISGVIKFLETIYNKDQDTIDFMQRLLGYGLTGLTTEHIFPFLLGKGRNGKSLFMETVMRVLGDYAAVIPSDLFLQSNVPRNTSQADPAIMKLEGLRLAVSSEVEEGSKFSAMQVKKLTGGDTLEGRNPYDKRLRNFKTTHLTIMIGNHEPTPPTGDPAFWDRTYLIKHPIRFIKTDPKNENERSADPDVEEKLKKLDSEFLTWMVIGCLEWQANNKKLAPPKSVLKATEKYQEEADYVGLFIEACCTTSNPDLVTGGSVLYDAFVVFYRGNINAKKNYTPSQHIFGKKLKARDQFKDTRRNGIVHYKGIGLNIEWHKKLSEMDNSHETSA